MSRKRLLIVLVCAAIFQSACTFRLAKATDQEKSERLATEEGRLSLATDPVVKLKSYLAMSEILLNFATESVRDGHNEPLLSFLRQYATAIQGARDTLAIMDINPRHPPLIYKDLEITMRGQIRLLGSVGQALTFDERKPVEIALQLATSLHNEALHRLFP